MRRPLYEKLREVDALAARQARSAHEIAVDLRREPKACDARAVCEALALKLAPRATARQAFACCPAHADRTPSCSVRVAKDGTLAARCHACGFSADVLGLVRQVHGFDHPGALAWLADYAGRFDVSRPLPDRAPAAASPTEPALSDETYAAIWTNALERCSPLRATSPRVATYLDARGIFADAEAVGVRGLPDDSSELVAALLATFERDDLELAGVLRAGHDAIDWPAWPLLIPWRDRFGRITCVQRRRLDDAKPKYLSPRGRSPRAPFGVELLGPALDFLGATGEIVIVEGALDCLARRRVARHRGEASAVLGAYSATTASAGLPLDMLAGRRVVLALDVDDAGDGACSALADAVRGVAAELVRERPVGAKDWNSAIEGGAA